MANKKGKKSREMTKQNKRSGFHPIRAFIEWVDGMSPVGRTVFGLGCIVAGTYVTHDVLEHDMMPSIKIANILEFSTKPKKPYDEDDVS